MIQFGTGGWRAIIGKDFVYDNIISVAQGLADMMKAQGQLEQPVMLGFDRRFLSYDAAVWIAQILCANGITVWFMKRTAPTPLIMYTVKTKGLYYGLQVTASHNPPTYNGIKLVVQGGRDASQTVTQQLEKYANAVLRRDKRPEPMPVQLAEKSGLLLYPKNPFNEFIDDIESRIRMDIIRERGLRILFDPMHGSGAYALMVLLYTARCTVDHINFERDAYFGGHMPAPSERSLQELREKVTVQGYDLGIAFDGDGDRLGIIDSNGRYITANEILVLLYYYLHEHRGWKGPVVRNMSTTHMLDKLAQSFGEVCYEVPVGFKYISQKIEETDAVLGGESSGGLTVRGHIPGKDSVYAAALLVEAVCMLKKSPSLILGDLYAKLGAHVMLEKSFPLTEEGKAAAYESLMVQRHLPVFGQAIERVSYEDGCKVYFKDGSFAVCRFSGTEPLLRLCAEAPQVAQAQGYMNAFREQVMILMRESAEES
ncbi:MAG: phosphoglucomutase/phosphomannomutase family protein [Clostridiales bacterium]|nr:phosphoglucomutase/phosphomannomutase family protein [Clostridiales bacterium]